MGLWNMPSVEKVLTLIQWRGWYRKDRVWSRSSSSRISISKYMSTAHGAADTPASIDVHRSKSKKLEVTQDHVYLFERNRKFCLIACTWDLAQELEHPRIDINILPCPKWLLTHQPTPSTNIKHVWRKSSRARPTTHFTDLTECPRESSYSTPVELSPPSRNMQNHLVYNAARNKLLPCSLVVAVSRLVCRLSASVIWTLQTECT